LTIGGSIGITQGNGNGDAAEIETVLSTGGAVTKAGPAPIIIGILQGNGNNDVAAIVDLDATGGATDGGATPITISQGSGNADWAEIANVTAPNANVSITQTDLATNANGDTALVLFVNVGVVGADNSDNNNTGNVMISQGSAPGDIADVAEGTANNVTIVQGSNGGVNGTLPTFDGSNIANDVAQINDETITSDITITQGNSNS